MKRLLFPSMRQRTMNARWLTVSGTVGSLLVLAAGEQAASAQSGGGYTIAKSTIDGGGVTAATGGGYVMSGTAGQPDVGDVAGGMYLLRGGFWPSSIPSDIEPVPPDGAGSHLDKNRFISFVIPTSGAGQDTAVRVRLTSLHHPPAPPDAPDLTAFEGEYRYLNSFRNLDDDPVFTCPDSPAFGTTFNCAVLGCEPEYRDWAAAFGGAVVHVTGAAVVPSSEYDVAHLAATCAGNEASCSAASLELSVATARWGNVNGDAVVSAVDVAAVVDKVRDASGALIKSRAMLQPATPAPLGPVSAIDLAQSVDANRGLRYPFTIAACP